MADEHEQEILGPDELVQMLRAMGHKTPTGEQEYVAASLIQRSHERLAADLGAAREREGRQRAELRDLIDRQELHVPGRRYPNLVDLVAGGAEEGSATT